VSAAGPRRLYLLVLPSRPASRFRVFLSEAEAEGFRSRMARSAPAGDRAMWQLARVVPYGRLRRTNPVDH
jgi:hypothetical protein